MFGVAEWLAWRVTATGGWRRWWGRWWRCILDHLDLGAGLILGYLGDPLLQRYSTRPQLLSLRLHAVEGVLRQPEVLRLQQDRLKTRSQQREVVAEELDVVPQGRRVLVAQARQARRTDRSQQHTCNCHVRRAGEAAGRRDGAVGELPLHSTVLGCVLLSCRAVPAVLLPPGHCACEVCRLR